MAWTKIDEMYIKNYTVLVVGGKMSIEQVPEKYRAEVKIRVESWFKTDSIIEII